MGMNQAAALICLAALNTFAAAQAPIQSAPGYERYMHMSKEAATSVKGGALSVTWKEGGKSFEFTRDKKKFRYEIETRSLTELRAASNAAPAKTEGENRRQERTGASPGRGRQFASVISPEGALKAYYKDRNVWLSDTNGSNAVAVTTEGNEKARIKFGTASWVYGEELYQSTALWWSSNSQKLAFYRFDESQVPDYYIALKQISVHDTLGTEAYPKAGDTNPTADIFIYDVASKKIVKVDVRDGKAFTDDVMGHYVYRVSWSADGKELIFHRTNRRQKVMELCAANVETGKCRVIVREEWPASWTENLPTFRFLKDGRRFIWSSDRTGWKNYYLYDLSGRLLAPLTQHGFEVAGILHVDEERGLMYYTGRDGENPLKMQLHCVSLDGTGERRLSDPKFHHTIDFAPDGRHFIDIAQTHDVPPVTRLHAADGKLVEQIASSDMSQFQKLGLRPVELLRFKAADGKSELFGLLHRPSNFNRWTKYPLLVSVYAGPETSGARETFTPPNPITELGFLVASFDSRGGNGRGKEFMEAMYRGFGSVEIDDQAAGVRSLYRRWYVSEKRVGIFGTSYGGTASAMALLRYPEVFRAACASSAVTDWHNYDSIYTERYMDLPRENAAGYGVGSVVNTATNLAGRLMIFYGTADDNVHPANSLQLVQALQRAGKSFEVQVGPDMGHTSLGRDRMMEFFIENLRR